MAHRHPPKWVAICFRGPVLNQGPYMGVAVGASHPFSIYLPGFLLNELFSEFCLAKNSKAVSEKIGCQVIQAVTKLYPRSLEVTFPTFEGVTFSPSQKGHKELPGCFCFLNFERNEYLFGSQTLEYQFLGGSSHDRRKCLITMDHGDCKFPK